MNKIEFIKSIQSPIFDLLSPEYLKITKEEIIAKIYVNNRLHQPFGILHGGISVLIAESLASLGSYLSIDETKKAVGIEINANHVRQVIEGEIVCTATALNLGRKIHLWEIKLTENEKLVCISRCTIAIIDNI